MPRSWTALPVFATLALACAAPALSEAQAPPGKPPAALETVRAQFAAAVAAKDRAGVASLSRFPLAMEGYGFPPKLGQADFLRDQNHFDGIFFDGEAELVKCLKTQAFAWQGDAKQFGARLWYLDCNGNEYYFGARGGAWAFTAYQNINE